MEYPEMFIVRDIQYQTIIASKDKAFAVTEAKRLDAERSPADRMHNPWAMVKSQMVGWLDEL